MTERGWAPCIAISTAADWCSLHEFGVPPAAVMWCVHGPRCIPKRGYWNSTGWAER